MQNISLLGSTGSIGTQTLEIVDLFPDKLCVSALAAGSRWDLLANQARRYHPEVVYLHNDAFLLRLREALAGLDIEVCSGEDGLKRVATMPDVDVVVAAMVGFSGLKPVLDAATCGKRIALANKETLVAAGELVTRTCGQWGCELIPVDSEHSAIYQCLTGEPQHAVERIFLTASGGPFRNRPAGTFDEITPEEALDHPNWDMGAKVTIDSATLMNKGLEVIEAYWLFGQQADTIEVVVHPESIVHSMVLFADGSTKAQLGEPDMRVPIQYALSTPGRWPAPHPRIDWHTIENLHFEKPDLDRFPCLGLAFDAIEAGGLAPVILNAANEVAVQAFLKGRIGFPGIPDLVRCVLESTPAGEATSLEAIFETDSEARRRASEELKRLSGNL